MSYDDFLAGLAKAHSAKFIPGYRYGQRYFNALPGPIAEVIRATDLDPFEDEEVSEATHNIVRMLWDRV